MLVLIGLIVVLVKLDFFAIICNLGCNLSVRYGNVLQSFSECVYLRLLVQYII